MRAILTFCLATLATLALTSSVRAGAQSLQDLDAPDRIEWDAGGVYEGRLADGSRFQLQLAYPKPAALLVEAQDVAESVQQLHGVRGMQLARRDGPGGVITLANADTAGAADSFVVTLTADKAGGSGQWHAGASHKRQDFSLRRVFTYREIALTHAPTWADSDLPGEETRPFVFSALFPLIDNAAVRQSLRDDVAVCDYDELCHNTVTVAWSSAGLLSLDVTSFGYSHGATHGYTTSRVRHYRVDGGSLTPLGLDDFLAADAACRDKVSDAIVKDLRAQGLSWPENGRLDSRSFAPRFVPRFMALPDGLEFHFDQYEVGSYAEGGPGVLLTRAVLGRCVKGLPRRP